MSKPAFNARILTNTNAQRNAAVTFLNNQLAGKDIFQQRTAPINVEQQVLCDILFNSLVDRDSLYTQTTTYIVTTTGVQPGSHVARHLCFHDEPGTSWPNCRDALEALYEQFVLT